MVAATTAVARAKGCDSFILFSWFSESASGTYAFLIRAQHDEDGKGFLKALPNRVFSHFCIDRTLTQDATPILPSCSSETNQAK